jgi:hypothetical protein
LVEVLRSAIEYVQARLQTALVELAADDLPAALREVDHATERLREAVEEIAA